MRKRESNPTKRQPKSKSFRSIRITSLLVYAVFLFSSTAFFSCKKASELFSQKPPIPTTAASSTQLPSPPPALQSAQPWNDGCWGTALPPQADQRLELLGKRCAEGMKSLFKQAQKLALEPGKSQTVPFKPSAHTCLRAIAVAEGGEASLELLDAHGKSLGNEHEPAFAMVDKQGPRCFQNPGELNLKVTRLSGSGSVWVQVWERAASNLPKKPILQTLRKPRLRTGFLHANPNLTSGPSAATSPHSTRNSYVKTGC
jgi:hypothetical protein